MPIVQHERVSGEPTHLTVNGTEVTIRFTDADPDSQPRRAHRAQDDSDAHHRTIDLLEEADDAAVTHWKQVIATKLVHELGIMTKVPAGTQFLLTSLPKYYKLIVHLKGDKDHPRRDYYLYGSKWQTNFRSPAEFVLHAKWLAFGGPLGEDDRPLCACKYCSKNDQKGIGRYLDNKAGNLQSRHKRPRTSRPGQRSSKIDAGKEIKCKDYTRLNEDPKYFDSKPDLLRIKDEPDA